MELAKRLEAAAPFFSVLSCPMKVHCLFQWRVPREKPGPAAPIGPRRPRYKSPAVSTQMLDGSSRVSRPRLFLLMLQARRHKSHLNPNSPEEHNFNLTNYPTNKLKCLSLQKTPK